MNRVLSITLVVAGICLLCPTDALAYLDPGTGSYALQLALAVLVGATFTVKMYWRKLKARLGIFVSPNRNSQSAQAPHSDE
jgi:hypothetical protein